MNAKDLREEYGILRIELYWRRGRRGELWPVRSHYRGIPGVPLTDEC
jgi:hypothetical protein